MFTIGFIMTRKFLLIIFFTLLGQSTVDAQECLTCGDYNRVNKVGQHCIETDEECGECLPGFIRDEEDDRTCFKLELTEFNDGRYLRNVFNEVFLPCTFNTKVHCQWSKDEEYMEIRDNLIWSGGDNGKDTDDCSITIQPFTKKDIGQWQCEGTSGLSSVKSTPIRLNIFETRIIKSPNSHYDVIDGQSITLPFTFDYPSECIWMKNDSPIIPNEKYKYDCKTTKDCSITIQSFNPSTDSGNWRCYWFLPGGNKKIIILKTELTAVTPSSQHFQTEYDPVTYLDESAVSSSSIDLLWGRINPKLLFDISCKAPNEELTCKRLVWLLDGGVEQGLNVIEGEIFLDQKLMEVISEVLDGL